MGGFDKLFSNLQARGRDKHSILRKSEKFSEIFHIKLQFFRWKTS